MAPESKDRRRMHEDLRELARLAKRKPSPAAPSTPPPAFESADSSGYVDLSKFSAADPHWVEREIARASARSRQAHELAPESMAPIALEAFTSADEGDTAVSARRRRRLFAWTAVAAGACAALAALVVVKKPAWLPFHHGVQAAAAHVAAPPAPAPPPLPSPAAPPATATPVAQNTATSSAPSEAAAAPSASASVATNTTAAAAGKTSKKRGGHPAHAHASAPRPASAQAAAAHPAQKASGGDSLMDLMRQSVDKH